MSLIDKIFGKIQTKNTVLLSQGEAKTSFRQGSYKYRYVIQQKHIGRFRFLTKRFIQLSTFNFSVKDGINPIPIPGPSLVDVIQGIIFPLQLNIPTEEQLSLMVYQYILKLRGNDKLWKPSNNYFRYLMHHKKNKEDI